MAHILFDQGKKIGEIEEWSVVPSAPTYKTFLGKTVLSAAGKDTCTFVSPKPVNRKSKLKVIEDGKREFNLELKSVKGSTFVTAAIVSINKI